MKLVLDINIVLDVVLERDPWADAAARLLSAIESGQAAGFVAAHTLPTIFYVVAQSRDRATAAAAVTDVLRIVDVAPGSRADFKRALGMPIADFEDAVQATAAITMEADYLVTRNEKDFRSVDVPTADPATVLALLEASSAPERTEPDSE